MGEANHIMHAVVSRQHIGIRLECLDGPGHVTVHGPEGEAWTIDDLPALTALGVVDTERCWVQDWIEECGVDLIDGDDWSVDGPWPVHCWFDGDSMRIEHAPEVPR